MSVTIGLLLAVAVLAWIIARVVTTLRADNSSSSAKRADYPALGGSAPSEDRIQMRDPNGGHNEYLDRARKRSWKKTM